MCQETPTSNADIRTILKTLSQYSRVRQMESQTTSAAAASPDNASSVTISAVIKSLQDQVALLATFPEDNIKHPKETTVCTECAKRANDNDELNLQIDALRRGWMEEKSEHVQASLDLEQLQRVVDVCDVTFQKLVHSKDGFLGNGLPLSQIAADTIATYCDEQRKQHWDETREALAQKSARMKKKGRDMVKANQIFHDFASQFNSELFRYSEWLDARCQSLQDNYQRYCQIMQEHGARPELLYDDQEVLSEAETSYTKAWTARLEAARKAMEAAQLYGLTDPFEGMVGEP
jgi:protein-arginine kinase activator protein McsA